MNCSRHIWSAGGISACGAALLPSSHASHVVTGTPWMLWGLVSSPTATTSFTPARSVSPSNVASRSVRATSTLASEWSST